MEMTQAVTALTALAHEGRLEIFRLLVRRAPDEVAAGELALALGVRGSTLSNQLGELERAGLIRSRREGRSVLYRVDLDVAGSLLGFLAVDCCKGRPEACLPIAGALLRRPGGEGGNQMTRDDRTKDDGSRVFNVLFLCNGNSARSIFAEAILNRVGEGRFRAFSAGAHPRGQIHPRAQALLDTLNFDMTGYRSKSWDEFARQDAPALDFVFTVCDKAANETCPVWPGQPMSAHWGIPDPAAVDGNETEVGLAFTEAYRFLFNRISAFVSLPIRSLDSLSLQKRLDEIGRQSPPDADAASPQAASGRT